MEVLRALCTFLITIHIGIPIFRLKYVHKDFNEKKILF